MNRITIIMTFMGCLICTAVFAQGPPGPPATPIDGGLTLLLAAGGVYGVKKLKDLQNKK